MNLTPYIKNIFPHCLLIFCLLAGIDTLRAQGAKPDNSAPEKKLVQLSGIINSSETQVPIPFSSVHILHSFRGTIAQSDGFYSMVVGEEDTVEYVALGFKKARFIIPKGIKDQKLTHNMGMEGDTIEIATVSIYPYLTPDEFKQAFLSLKLEDKPGDIARQNLDPKKLAELYETLARDGSENQLYTLQQIASSYYYAGGQRNYATFGGTPVPTSLLNPFAWAEFIKAIKQGKYKIKKE